MTFWKALKELLRLIFEHKLIQCWKCKKQAEVPLPKPTLRGAITGRELEAVIRVKFPTGWIYLSDAKFDLCDIEDIELFLDIDETNHIKYQKRAFDCENYSRLLWGNLGVPGWSSLAIGLMWTDKHALIMCVDANRDLWLLEPQTDARRSDLMDWQGTAMRFIIV